MVVGPAACGRLEPVMANWWATNDYRTGYYGPPLRLAETRAALRHLARLVLWVGGATALETLLEIGIDEIHAHDVRLANRFREAMGLDPSDGAIVPVEADGAAERLAAAGRTRRRPGGNARLSFHVYNTDDDVERGRALRGRAHGIPAATRRRR